MDFVGKCAEEESFKAVLRLPEARWKDGTPADFVLRFFALAEEYKSFDHSVKDFLNNFAEAAAQHPELRSRESVFQATFDYLSKVFPDGLKTRKGQTPVNLFEATAVGASLALHSNHNLSIPSSLDWVRSDELRSLTAAATNSNKRVRGRIEFCRDHFLG